MKPCSLEEWLTRLKPSIYIGTTRDLRAGLRRDAILPTHETIGTAQDAEPGIDARKRAFSLHFEFPRLNSLCNSPELRARRAAETSLMDMYVSATDIACKAKTVTIIV